MRRFLPFLALLAATGAASAADMAVKAAPLSNVYPTGCGWYYGLVAQGSSGVVNGAPAGTVQIGGDVGGLVGYACAKSAIPWFAEIDIEAQNLNAGNAGFTTSGPLHVEAEFAIQTPILTYFGQWLNIGQANIPAPTVWLPTGFSVKGAPVNYLGVVTVFDDVSTQFGVAHFHEVMWTPVGLRTGILFNLTGPNSQQVVADAFAGLDLQSNAVNFGSGMVAPNGSTSVKFSQKFVTGIKFKM